MIRRPPRSTLLTHSFPTRRSSDLPFISAVQADRPARRIGQGIAGLGPEGRVGAFERRLGITDRRPEREAWHGAGINFEFKALADRVAGVAGGADQKIVADLHKALHILPVAIKDAGGAIEPTG